MIQCPQEHLLFCTLCESRTGFLRPPELRSGHRLKNLLSSSRVLSCNAKTTSTASHFLPVLEDCNAATARHPSSVSYSKLLSRLCCFIIDCWTDKLRCVSTLISGPPSDRLWLRDFHHRASWWLKPKTDYWRSLVLMRSTVAVPQRRHGKLRVSSYLPEHKNSSVQELLLRGNGLAGGNESKSLECGRSAASGEELVQRLPWIPSLVWFQWGAAARRTWYSLTRVPLVGGLCHCAMRLLWKVFIPPPHLSPPLNISLPDLWLFNKWHNKAVIRILSLSTQQRLKGF